MSGKIYGAASSLPGPGRGTRAKYPWPSAAIIPCFPLKLPASAIEYA